MITSQGKQAIIKLEKVRIENLAFSVLTVKRHTVTSRCKNIPLPVKHISL